MASIACVVVLLIAACTTSLLAAPGQDHRKASDVIERVDKQTDSNAAPPAAPLATPPAAERPSRRNQPQETDLPRKRSPQRSNVRRRHRRRKLGSGGRRSGTRRSDTATLPRGGGRNKLQDSDVAIILAKLNPGAAGTPSSVRPYRFEASGRDLTPLQDDSDETLNDILQALKLQVAAGRERAKDNATQPNYSTELGENLVPVAQAAANESTEVKHKEPQFNFMENLAETYTEPTFESVIESGADALKTDTPSLLPSEYSDDDSNNEAQSRSNLGNDEQSSLKEETTSSIESRLAFRVDLPDSNAGDEDGQLMADTLESGPLRCSQSEDGAVSPCLGDNALSQADSQYDASRGGDVPCIACQQTDVDDVTTPPPGTCPAFPPTLAGRNGEDLSQEQKDETEDVTIQKELGLSVNRKSYKISIIFQ